MRALVTGVAGFIGSTLAERLVGEGVDVVGVDCFTDYYSREVKEQNLATVRAHATNPALAAELLACRRLVKGYSDTHSRGTAKFDQVLTALPLIAHREDAAAWIRRLREAALADEHGTLLAGAIATIRTLDPEPAHA